MRRRPGGTRPHFAYLPVEFPERLNEFFFLVGAESLLHQTFLPDAEKLQYFSDALHIFMNNATICGLSGKYLTDWTGPEGELKEISFRIGTPCFPGDAMTMTGKVVKKYTEGDQHLVDVEYEFTVPQGRNCGGKGTIALPTRGR